jgi:chromosome segregation ATPase
MTDKHESLPRPDDNFDLMSLRQQIAALEKQREQIERQLANLNDQLAKMGELGLQTERINAQLDSTGGKLGGITWLGNRYLLPRSKASIQELASRLRS